MLAYDGCWSPDLLTVGLTAAIEREIHELQTQRLVLNATIAGFFKKGREAVKKLDRGVAEALKEIAKMKMLHRGIEPEDLGEIEGFEDEDDASMFVRVFSRLGVQKQG